MDKTKYLEKALLILEKARMLSVKANIELKDRINLNGLIRESIQNIREHINSI